VLSSSYEKLSFDNFIFTVRSDATKYNNATSAQLREEFREWARSSDEPLQEQGFPPEERFRIKGRNRYRCFIRVDEEALQSIGDSRWGQQDQVEGMGNVVHADWPHDKNESDGDGEDEEDDEDEADEIV
jgi:hypothetical protein